MKPNFKNTAGVFIFLLTVLAFSMIDGCFNRDAIKPVPESEPATHIYVAGEIIYPDYAHDDTLIVVNPSGLNEDLSWLPNGTDMEISYVLHRHCAVAGTLQRDYAMDVDNEGYTLYDYAYRDSIRVKWGTNFDSLIYKWND